MELFKYPLDRGFAESVNLRKEQPEWYVFCLLSNASCNPCGYLPNCYSNNRRELSVVINLNAVQKDRLSSYFFKWKYVTVFEVPGCGVFILGGDFFSWFVYLIYLFFFFFSPWCRFWLILPD